MEEAGKKRGGGCVQVWRLSGSDKIPRMTNLTEIIRNLEAERDRIDAAIKALKGAGGASAKQGKHRTMSAAGRARIAAAQRARWAKVRRAGK